MRILAIGADPVDLLVACGGTLLLYAQAGHEVNALIVADAPVSRAELERATAAFASVSYLEPVLVDTVVDSHESRDALMDVMREVSPDVIIAPSSNSIRESERALARLVFGAAYCACVPNYASPRGLEASTVRAVILHTDPTLGFQSGTPEYVDIVPVWDAKRAAIELFDHAADHVIRAEALAGARGVQVQRELAEAFGTEPAWGRLRPHRVLP